MNTTTLSTPAPLADLCPKRVLQVLGQPALMLGTVAASAAALLAGVPLGLASLVILFTAVAALFAAERAIPFREDWSPSASEWRRDSVYFGLNGLTSTLIPIGVSILAIHLARETTGLSLAAELPLTLLVASFVGYWTHRLGHEVGALWQLHGVHHTPDKVNAWNNNTIHFLDLVFQNGTSLAVIVLLGFSAEAIFLVTMFTQVLGFLDHANADFRMGPLNYLIGSPEQHRLHHSTDLEEAGHYSSLPLWDLVFGTFTWEPGKRPAVAGVVDPESFPPASSILQNAVHPFRTLMARTLMRRG